MSCRTLVFWDKPGGSLQYQVEQPGFVKNISNQALNIRENLYCIFPAVFQHVCNVFAHLKLSVHTGQGKKLKGYNTGRLRLS